MDSGQVFESVEIQSMTTPKVSIGIPVFNGAERIRTALNSILRQDFTDFEVIISDNASTDNTGSICRDYAQMDRRVRYYRNEINIGINPNHDRVFELSSGKYFAWFADDVEYLPGMLHRCVAALEAATPSVVLLHPRCEMLCDGQVMAIDQQSSIESGDRRPFKRLKAVVSRVVMVNQFFGLTKREALAKTHLNGPYPSSDYVLLAELAMLGEICELPEVLIRRRIDSDRGTAAVYQDEQAWKIWSGAGGRTFKDFLPQRERLALEYVRAAWRSPIRLADKLPCLLFVLPVYYQRTSRIARAVAKLARPWRWKRNSPQSIRQEGL
jgi:glycosyltransferase involved in cell wall biosynthesis